MTLLAALFLFVFGALGAWLVFVRFPSAHFTRAAYICMALGGLSFLGWVFWHLFGAGIAAISLLVIGGVCGAIGAVRKELRILPPS